MASCPLSYLAIYAAHAPLFFMIKLLFFRFRRKMSVFVYPVRHENLFIQLTGMTGGRYFYQATQDLKCHISKLEVAEFDCERANSKNINQVVDSGAIVALQEFELMTFHSALY